MTVPSAAWLGLGTERDFPGIDQLVAGALRREARAERLLYERHAKPIHCFVLGWVHDGEDASEVVQETFARAFRLLPTLGAPEQFRPWLYGIARNVCLECLKLRRSRPCPDTLRLLRSIETESPEHDFMGREAARLMQDALSNLPCERREALRLRIERGLSYQEIAVSLGCSVAKAKVEVHRARRALARALGAAYAASRRSARVVSGAMALCFALSLALVLCGSSPAEAPAPPSSRVPMQSSPPAPNIASEPLASLLPDASVYTACVMPPESSAPASDAPQAKLAACAISEIPSEPAISECPVTSSLTEP